MRTSWKEERRYPDANGEFWVIVHKRLDYEGKGEDEDPSTQDVEARS